MQSSLVDVEALRVQALEGLRAAWQVLQAEHAEERCYGFGFASHDAGSISTSAFTEEGLAEVVQRYQEMAESGDHPYLTSRSLDDLRISLRWSPGDSPRGGIGRNELDPASTISLDSQAAFDRMVDDFDDTEDDAEIEREYEQRIATVYDVLIEVLNTARSEGLFGDLTDTLVLNVWEGDQSFEDRSRFALRCNPPEVAQRFIEEEEASYSR